MKPRDLLPRSAAPTGAAGTGVVGAAAPLDLAADAGSAAAGGVGYPPPRFLFVDVNRRCNLRCQHCMYWKTPTTAKSGQISIDRRDQILGEFAALNRQGTVVICGGETMLDPQEYFAVTRRCRAAGLRCLSVINGTGVADAEMADRTMQEGPSEITVSLNSHRAEVHDRTRGMRGSFDRAVRALRLLLAARETRGHGSRIFAMAVICEQNYRELDAFYSFVLDDIGADKLKLNFLQPTFGPPTWWYRDQFFERNAIKDEEELAAIIRACDKKYGLRINPAWLHQVRMYHRSVRENGALRWGWRRGKGTAEHICNSYERNIMVDLYGRARLCFNPAFPATCLSGPGDLRRFWENAGGLRHRMSRCNRYCGISHSVRRESATLPPPVSDQR
jgi:MoaA/NifB/PqqE/SkfB family radical SAM enzyme